MAFNKKLKGIPGQISDRDIKEAMSVVSKMIDGFAQCMTLNTEMAEDIAAGRATPKQDGSVVIANAISEIEIAGTNYQVQVIFVPPDLYIPPDATVVTKIVHE